MAKIVALDVLIEILKQVYAKAKKYTDRQISTSLDSLRSLIGANREDINTNREDITTLKNTTSTQQESINGLQSKLGTAESNITTLQTTTGKLSSSVATLQSRLGTAESNIEELQNIVSNVYTIKGSIAFENLPTEINIGWVYNISDDFITTDNFIEGAGIQCKAGTNIVVVNIGTNEAPIKKWDILSLGTSIDYASTDDIKNIFSEVSNE